MISIYGKEGVKLLSSVRYRSQKNVYLIHYHKVIHLIILK